ncbi:hypothetical protein [Streptomyces virginiae]|uniref:hypothetical protein n=1 Tax=Streptomyces virginiae TaxID=1961 RepID=UPI00225BBD03|nr:hypothetical protein [Streptomyces virginiae]MCX4957513.1 hypothetical protein [Streptomyces virginiae]MCX5176255.1 hypothetical protein [Streptomyces virginiae]
MTGITAPHGDRHDDLVIEELVQETRTVGENNLCICWVTSLLDAQADSAVSVRAL